MRQARLLFLCLLALTGVCRLSARADLTVGATREIPEGKLDYTPSVPDLAPQSGEYAPRIPLEVLPGPSGQAPSLALVYSVKRHNGPPGVGWGLSFESSIERKSKDGGIAKMREDDTFWVDGEKLILTSDGTYRKEQTDFTVYTKVTDSAGITGWRALKDGFTRHYGISASATGTTDANAVEYQDEDSAAGVATGTKRVRWHLSKTTTAFGVEVSYRYIIPEVAPLGRTSGRHLPDKIIYAQTATGWNEVSFAYEVRKDIRVSYGNGPERIESKRLRSIVVKRIADTATVSHEYVLTYGDSANSPQTLLLEIERKEVIAFSAGRVVIAAGGTESIARFTYTDNKTAFGERQAIKLIGDPPPVDVQSSDEYFNVPMVADVNGDSRPDLGNCSPG
jgi:hypothetical protein